MKNIRFFLSENFPFLVLRFSIYLNRRVFVKALQRTAIRPHKEQATPGPEVIKHFSCLFQLSIKFSLLINMKMPTIVGIFIFMSREIFMFNYVWQERISIC